MLPRILRTAILATWRTVLWRPLYNPQKTNHVLAVVYSLGGTAARRARAYNWSHHLTMRHRRRHRLGRMSRQIPLGVTDPRGGGNALPLAHAPNRPISSLCPDLLRMRTLAERVWWIAIAITLQEPIASHNDTGYMLVTEGPNSENPRGTIFLDTE